MPAAFIDDGYTEMARIAAVEGVFPAVRFCFRPVTAGEFGAYADRMQLANDIEARRITAEFLASKLVDWDIRRRDGTKVEITTDNLLRLKHMLYLKLFQIIVGETTSDEPSGLGDATAACLPVNPPTCEPVNPNPADLKN